MSETSSSAPPVQRRTIAVFNNYADAERAVDYLSDRHFPVERVAIVGHDLSIVEQVTGRLNYGSAALRGAGTGAVTGALIGLVMYALQRGRRDFSAVKFVAPARYEVVADPDVADEALRMLSNAGIVAAGTRNSTGPANIP